MSNRVETGDVLGKIRTRPPIEYLRKLAPTEAEAQRYLALAEKAKVVQLSQLGKEEQIFDVYVPLLDAKVKYGLIGLNEVVEWVEADLDLGEAPTPPVLDKKTGAVIKPGKPGRPGKRIDEIKATRKMAYLLLHKADPALTEEQLGQYSPQVLTQLTVAIAEHTPFFGAIQTAIPTSSTSKPPALQ